MLRRILIRLFLCGIVHMSTSAQNLKIVFSDPGKMLQHFGIDTTDAAFLRSLVDTAELTISQQAAVLLARRGDTEIVNTIKRRISESWDEKVLTPKDYVAALYLLNDPQTQQYTHALLDSLESQKKKGEARFFNFKIISCIDILLNLGDYSQYALLNSLFDDPEDPLGFVGVVTLAGFASNPLYRDSVYVRLQHFLSRQDDDLRWQATYYLSRFTDMPGQQSLLQSIALNDSSWFIRSLAMDALKKLYYDPLVLEAAKRIVLTTQDKVAFTNMLVEIKLFDSPLALVTLEAIANELPPGYFKDYAAFEVEFYAPSRPHAESSVLTMIDSLRAHVPQVATLGWLADATFVTELDKDLQSARSALVSGDSTGCVSSIKSFQSRVDTEYRDSLDNDNRTVTVEGWKFLYYNAQYILDRLPARPQEPPFVVQVDSLSASLAAAYANGWIGDKGLINSLKKQLTDARKSLEKGNLTRASAQLQNFLNRLGKVYHRTLKEQQKGNRKLKNFVTEEGFTFLAGKTTELLTKLGSLGEILSVPGQFTTIQAAVNAAKPGATIEVDAGTYKELVEIQKKDSLTLLASEEVTIQGVRIARSNVITVKGFIIDAAGTKKDAVEIEGQENTDITIEANEIVNSSKNGISAGKHNVRTRIVNNLIAGNEKNGIDFADGADGAQYVLNNTIVKNGWNGVEAASQKNLYLVNNIISFNGTAKGDAQGRYGLRREGKAGRGKITLLNNLIIGNDGKVNKQSSRDVANYDQVFDGTDNGNITTTGREGLGVSGSSAQSFGEVLLADYRLTETSVAIDKGIASFAAPDAEAGKLPEEDKDGTPRPQRTRIDLGAFELE